MEQKIEEELKEKKIIEKVFFFQKKKVEFQINYRFILNVNNLEIL